ncbi:MAG TPA: DnaA/Hda family protein [Phenylobacterium sp.]|jgi:chromosomal replication initiation ATPase DnaA|nr:DnaA/Hda family protein [Phenylobacterium sp.]
MARQLRLSLRRPTTHTRDAFVRGASNAPALEALDAWPRWPAGALALIGPEGVGKTHLARAWAAATKAVVLDRQDPDFAAAAGRPALVEDVDQGAPDEALFHLINQAQRDGASLLLTARAPPAAWTTALPDLRSRLNALLVAEIEAPDDEVLTGVLRNFFRERNIRPNDDVYPYLLRRMERSIPGAQDIVRRLDETEDGQMRPVSRLLAREILESDIENLDLFEG